MVQDSSSAASADDAPTPDSPPPSGAASPPEAPPQRPQAHAQIETTKTDRWCFTCYHETPPELAPHSAYSVAGHEVAPDTGRLHWQGYTRFKTRKFFSTTKALFRRLGHAEDHLEPARGSEQQNKTYCTKDHTDIHETGHFLASAGISGARSDLAAVQEKLAAGAPLKKMASSPL